MRILLPLGGALLCVAASAQSPLLCVPPAGTGYYGWNTPPPIHTNLLNLTVTTQITLQAIATPLFSPNGQTGSLEVWLTNPGTTTYVGNETNAGMWSLAASGVITGLGTTGTVAGLTATSCQSASGTGLVLNPGSYGVLIRYVGVAPLLAAVVAPQTYTNAELTVSGGAVQYTPFTAPNAPPAGFAAWSWRGSIIYQNGVFPHACAEAVKYGTGCNTVRGSAHQEFTDSSVPSAAGAASAALTNRQLLFLPSGTGYVMLPGTATFLPPSGAAVALPSNDDGETAITPTLPFQYPGGITTQLFVHTNGFVSVASNNTIPGGLNYVPQIPGMLAATSTGWWSWHDLNPTEAASGQIVWEEVGSIVAITWQGVESYPTTAANPSTFQFQFDMLAGTVTILWQTIDAVGGSGFLEGDDWVIGYSPGGPSPNGVAFDITTLTATALAFPEVFPLALDTSSKPLLGTTIDLVTSNETGQNLGINFVSVVGIPAPGFDLSILGMPGCVALLDINAGVGNVISNLGVPGISMNVSFPLPPNPALASIKIYSQSIWLDPLANPFGATASNAIEMTLGNF